MATPRQFFQGSALALVPSVATLYGRTGAASGGNGTVSVSASRSLGFTSITKAATGRYTVTLDQKYYTLEALHVWFIDDASTGIESWSLYTDLSAGGNSFTVELYDSAGSATNLPDGAIMCVKAEVRTTRS